MLRISFLTSRILAINSTPISSFPRKILDFSLYLEKSIFKSFRVLERIKANTISTLLREITEKDIQNLLNLCTPCIFVYRNPQGILQEFYELTVTETVVLKLEEKSKTLALCLFELQNCLLSLGAVSETINKCIIVHTDK